MVDPLRMRTFGSRKRRATPTSVSHTKADGAFTLKGVAETDYVVHADIYVKPGYRKFCGQDVVVRANDQSATAKFLLERQGADCGD
jgi:hypothetical protein